MITLSHFVFEHCISGLNLKSHILKTVLFFTFIPKISLLTKHKPIHNFNKKNKNFAKKQTITKTCIIQ